MLWPQNTLRLKVGKRPQTRWYSAPARRPFKFHVGVSFYGKPALPGEKLKTPGFPDGPIKRWRDEGLQWKRGIMSKSAGHDFYFVQEMKNSSGVSIGVADGVGGWTNSGDDPSLFSQALMYHAHQYMKNGWAGEPESDPTLPENEPVEGWEMTPSECLHLAHAGVLREKAVKCGSSTACILSLNATSGVLKAANLGDSGFLIIRSANIYHFQPPQTHGFNFPLQLSKFPVDNPAYGNPDLDHPSDADLYTTQLRGGDVILAFTDGLSDNVFPADILQLANMMLRRELPMPEAAQDIADRLVLQATISMWDRKGWTPFGLAQQKQGHSWKGGKVDDVLVTSVLVQED